MLPIYLLVRGGAWRLIYELLLKKEGNQVDSTTTQLKLLVPDGKKHLSDMLDYKSIIALDKVL